MQDASIKSSQGQVTRKESKGIDVLVNFTECFFCHCTYSARVGPAFSFPGFHAHLFFFFVNS